MESDARYARAAQPGVEQGITATFHNFARTKSKMVTDAIGLLFDLWRKNEAMPFDRLRANGFSTEIVENFPFVLSLSKYEQR